MMLKRIVSFIAALSLMGCIALAEEDELDTFDDEMALAAQEDLLDDEDSFADAPFETEDDFAAEDDDIPANTTPVTATPEEIAAAKAWEALVYDGVVIDTGLEDGQTMSDLLADIDEQQESWMLMLVNRDHPIPSDWEVGSLAEVKGGQKVARRILPALQEMFNAARSEGIKPQVNSGYRTRAKQESLLNEKYKDYIKEGLSEDEAMAKALEWVATPGTSEHEAGLGIDIKAASGSTDKVYEWLAANSWKYGFVLRYPEDKTAITGIMNEPWHFRYVGKLAAAEMYQLNMCLEEYLEYKGLMPNGTTTGDDTLPAVDGDLLAEATESPDALEPLLNGN